MNMRSYDQIRSKIIAEHLDKFPDAGSRTIAKILCRDYSEFFTSIETARGLIRYRRGANGEESRKQLKDKKYVKQVQSA